jgi:hypothetical protein
MLFVTYLDVLWHQHDELGPMLDLFSMGETCFLHEIHCQMIEVYGDGVMRVQHVRMWRRELRNSQMDIMMMITLISPAPQGWM